MKRGDAVIVDFDGEEHDGEFIAHRNNGWVECRIAIDPELDYGSIGPRLAPHSIVMVRETAVKGRDQ